MGFDFVMFKLKEEHVLVDAFTKKGTAPSNIDPNPVHVCVCARV